MMKYIIIYFFFSIFLSAQLSAQNKKEKMNSKDSFPLNKLSMNVYRKANGPGDTLLLKAIQVNGIALPIRYQQPLKCEKLYLHIDRELYYPGDTIWFKAYLINGINHQLNSNFRNIYIQLINKDGRVIEDKILLSAKGQAHGELSTDSLPDGIYTIRAFTRYLGNFGEETYFHKKIWITKSKNTNEINTIDPTNYSKIEISFLPESGNLILNALNTVAFKAIDSHGRGIYVSGKILNDLDDTIVSFSASYRGMGKFQIIPLDEVTYYAVIDQNSAIRIKLEPPQKYGMHLNFRHGVDSLLFTMSSNKLLAPYRQFYFKASHKGLVFLYKKITMASPTGTLKLSKDLFPEGISNVSLLDLSLNTIAERLIFINDDKADRIKLQLNKQEFKPREAVTIQADALLMPDDSINSTLSLSVVNKNYLCHQGNSLDIKSYLLLNSELKGSIEMPAQYFIDDESISSTDKLDFLMMINGWRTYIWDVIEATKIVKLSDMNDSGIEIKGNVISPLRKKPLVNAEVTLLSSRTKFTMAKTTTNEQGRFNFARMVLENNTRVMINAKTNNGSTNAKIKLDPQLKIDSIVSPSLLNSLCFDVSQNMIINRDNPFRKLKELKFITDKTNIILPAVDIVKRKSINDDGHFRLYTIPDQSLTVTKDDYTYLNVFDYLTGKVPGLQIYDNGNGYQISIRQGGMPLFLIDGVEVDNHGMDVDVVKQVERISMNDIDKVEILKSGGNLAIYGSEGGNGIIAIYRKTKESSGFVDNHSESSITTILKGFSIAQKFYSPGYTLENINNPKPDYRPTLYWNPELGIENGKANIDFYTSDETGHYVVVVEGISNNGKICFGTSSFSVNLK